MKKSLLFLGLLGYAGSSFAQAPNLGPWVQVNTVNFGTIPPGYRVTRVNTVSENVAWIVAQENTATGTPTTFLVTNNAAGTEFEFGGINGVGTGQNFETANISGISATTAVAATFGGQAGGGEILRTTTGGTVWTKATTVSQFVANNGGFLDFVHMFDANNGVAVGDPTNGYFEILRTTDGGASWNRVPTANIPAPTTGEAALVGSVFALGNTIWFGSAFLGASTPTRVFKSTDQGQTWTASPVTALTESISKLAFKDPNNGVAYNQKVVGGVVTEVNMIRTSDGGSTWSTITPINNAAGSFYRYDIDAVNGRYYSSGQRFPSAAANEDFGFSTSTDGVNWTNIVSGGAEFFAFDLVPGATPTAAPSGYGGLSTTPTGSGGVYKATNVAVLASRDAALQSALSVYPNPSANGLFTVDLGSNLQAGAQLTVADALGRKVKSQMLNATAVGSRKVNLDLSNEKTGVYTLQIRTAAGIATQKLVVE